MSSCILPVDCNQMSRLCLDTSLIEEFKNNGVVVVPSVLTTDEVAAALRGLKTYLLACGCDEDNLMDTAGCLTSLSSTNGAGGILDVFYEDWKLCLNEHSAVVGTIQSLWQHTYATYDGNEHDSLYKHPFGQFDPLEGYMYVDRVCYRVPSDVSAAFGPTKRKQLQRSLTPHLDCCPHNMYGKGSKWRPIQAFLCLTDTLLPDQGGFEACPGHHVNFEQWAENRAPSAGYKGDEGGQVTAPCVGDFTPIRPAEDKDVLQKMRHIPCKAGDLVCWVSALLNNYNTYY